MSTWQIYADSYDNDSDFSNGTKSIRFKMPSGKVLTYIKTWIACFNNPSFTNITAKIYSDNNGSKGILIDNGTSLTTHLKADVLTHNSSVSELYFQFNNLPLDSSNWYHFVLSGVSSGFTESSHIAWKSSYPYPVYTTGLSTANLSAYPFICSCVGASF